MSEQVVVELKDGRRFLVTLHVGVYGRDLIQFVRYAATEKRRGRLGRARFVLAGKISTGAHAGRWLYQQPIQRWEPTLRVTPHSWKEIPHG